MPFFSIKVNGNASLMSFFTGLFNLTYKISTTLTTLFQLHSVFQLRENDINGKFIDWNINLKDLPEKVVCVVNDTYVFLQMVRFFNHKEEHPYPMKTAKSFVIELKLKVLKPMVDEHSRRMVEVKSTLHSFLRSIRQIKQSCGMPQTDDDIIIEEPFPLNDDDDDVQNISLVKELEETKEKVVELEKKIVNLTERLDKRRRGVRKVVKKRPAQPSRPVRKSSSSSTTSSATRTKKRKV